MENRTRMRELSGREIAPLTKGFLQFPLNVLWIN